MKHEFQCQAAEGDTVGRVRAVLIEMYYVLFNDDKEDDDIEDD